MGKMTKAIKNNYKIVNIVILSICIYLVVFMPFVSKLLEKISPTLTKCVYLQLTGKPCPLCGGTRFLQNIKNVFYDFSYVLNIFGLITLIIILEIIFRIINIKCKQDKKEIIIFDIIIHTILFIAYIVYVIWYIC